MADLSTIQALVKRLSGVKDPRGPVGILGRGKNIYNTTSHAAHKGGGSQYGRPKGSGKKQAAIRRLNGNRSAR